MTWLTAVVLGVVQGLTEFLPVSSSAHLILARAVMGWDTEAPIWLSFDVACHVGTLIAVFAVFWRDLIGMLRATPGALTGATTPDARRVRLIILGTVPVVIAGALGGGDIEDMVRTPGIVAITLALGAVILLVAERARAATAPETALTMRDAFVVGVAQAAALVPGISRSGITISA